MIYFAYHPKTRPTGRKIADALGIIHKGTFVGKRKVANPDFLVRWGNARRRELDQGRTINTAEAIWRAGDKVASFQAFDANGVVHPDFWATCPGVGVVLGRSKRGFGGTDIQICGHAPCVRAEFFCGYTPTKREYRLHVVGERVVRVQRKYLERPELKRSDYIMNHANGYVFKSPAKRLNRDREAAAINAVKALGLDFGAVDLLIGEDNKPYVLEVNTAPACAPKTLNAYVHALAPLVRERSNDDYILYPDVAVQDVLGDDE